LSVSDCLFIRSTEIAAPVAALRDWHFAEGAFERLTPPWEKVRLLESPFPLRNGSRAIVEVRIGPLRRRWVAIHEITEHGFIDRQGGGPFAFWEHEHRFEAIDERTSRLTDRIRYRLPFGWPGRIFGRPMVERKLDRLFRYRHEVTARSLTGHPDKTTSG
jgi:ligand-binding SRPBCC domain-containing protein